MIRKDEPRRAEAAADKIGQRIRLLAFACSLPRDLPGPRSLRRGARRRLEAASAEPRTCAGVQAGVQE